MSSWVQFRCSKDTRHARNVAGLAMDTLMRGLALRKETVLLLSQLSGLSGYLSISFWLFAQIPQVIKNHTDKSVDGFSLGFLLCWFAGDFLNLVSCLLNDAMAFQILLSGYYCAIDLVLAFQYYYYKQMYHNPESRWYHPPRRRGKHIRSPRTSLRNNLETYGSIDTEMMIDQPLTPQQQPQQKQQRMMRAVASPGLKVTPRNHVKGVFKKQNTGISKLVTSALISGFTKVQGLPIVQQYIDTELLQQQHTPGILEGGKENNSVIYRIIEYLMTMDSYKLGKILAWACTALYLMSRIPQMYTNYKLQSTRGISLKLICFALCGNFFYSASLLLSESSTVGGDVSREFWKAELSYLIGAFGTVMFDCSVLVQWYFYDFRGRYRRTKSGKLRLISPALDAGHRYMHSSENGDPEASNASKMISINVRRSTTDPINVSASVKSTLSPSHMKKISEFTPLSPMDFLLDDYMANHTVSQPASQPASQTENMLSQTKKSARSSIHTALAAAKKPKGGAQGADTNTGADKHRPVANADEELNMSMDEEDTE